MKSFLVSLPSLALALLFAATESPAATFVVDTTADEPDAATSDGLCATASGACSLRAAIQQSNSEPGPDTVQLPAGVFELGLMGVPENLGASGDLDVRDDLTLEGAGADSTVIVGSTGWEERVIDVVGAVAVSISGARISGSADPGGALIAEDANSQVSLADVAVTQNQGVGINSDGVVDLLRVTVSENQFGASLYEATIRQSSFYDNPGDALSYSDVSSGYLTSIPKATIRVFNSTLTGSFGSVSWCFGSPPGTTCYHGSRFELNNVTLGRVGIAEEVSGLPVIQTRPKISNSVVLDCDGPFESLGYNLIESARPSCDVTGDLTTTQIDVPAQLYPLADYGGPTLSRPPMPGSPLIEAANPNAPGGGAGSCEFSDQHENARPFGTRCDIGAVEVSCGDAVVELDEECDDGNTVDGDGCDTNCTISACGNGIVAPGEECDDGNLTGGDCCDASCGFEPTGSQCIDDGNPCTANTCNATGQCEYTAAAAGIACDDGNLCTTDDQCDGNATCVGTFCDRCLECDEAVGCVIPDCLEAPMTKAKVKLKQGNVVAKDLVSIKWKGGAVAKADLPNPLGSTLDVCIYDGDGSVLISSEAPDACGSGSCWVENTNTYKYFDETGQPDGIKKVTLKTAKSSRVVVKGRGENLALPPLPVSVPVDVLIFGEEPGRCFAATFNSLRKNDATQIKAQTP